MEDSDISLNDGQRKAVEAVLEGRSVFITGGAGTGKSVALREAVRRLREAGRAVMVCAPTGIAALQVDGVTINRALGFPTHVLLDTGGLNPSRALCAADVLVVDEVGMVRADVMDAIAHVVEVAGRMRYRGEDGAELVERARPKRYQVVLCGDLLQLPPVVTDEDRRNLCVHYEDAPATSSFFCFESAGWASLAPESHVLTQVMRQRGDDGFVDLLNRVRVGDGSCLGELNRHVDGRRPETAVFMAHSNRAVSELNRRMLAESKGRRREYLAVETGQVEKGDRPADTELVLKVGARVMAVVNEQVADGGYVNGSLGFVRRLEPDVVHVQFDGDGRTTGVTRHEWVIKRYEAKKDESGRTVLHEVRVGTFSQFPLKLAWGMTIHKSQGQTFDEVVVDPQTSHPTPGLLYVALSRCRSAKGLHLTRKVTPSLLVADGDAVSFYKSMGWSRPLGTGPAGPGGAGRGGDGATAKTYSAEAVPPRAARGGSGAEADRGDPFPEHRPETDEAAAAGRNEGSGNQPGVAGRLSEVERELHGILSRDSSWARVYELVRRVEVDGLWRDGGHRSFSAWVRAEAEREGVSTSLLWHRRSAGMEWERLAGEVDGMPRPGDEGAPSALNEANLNLLRKISRHDEGEALRLAGELAGGRASHRDLVTTWRSTRARAAAEGRPAAPPNSREAAPADADGDRGRDAMSAAATHANDAAGRDVVTLSRGRIVVDFGEDDALGERVMRAIEEALRDSRP